ncbi:MAG: (2Fe-2S) ferredoxin domain-containing protein [Bdellovibrionales bacterium]|nr:(2Fe-2S) ferredoxin domain-containing protein [Bdellovibrionales bacterium]
MAKDYDAHLFICTNTRSASADGKPRESCGAKGSEKLREIVKTSAATRFRGMSLRVNSSGCLGACQEGIVSVCYSRSGGANWNTHLSNTSESAEILLRNIEETLSS